MTSSNAGNDTLWTTLSAIERTLRHASDLVAFRFSLVSEPRRLLPYQQAVLLEKQGAGRYRVGVVSNVATVDRNAPYVRFLERLVKYLDQKERLSAAGQLSVRDIEKSDLAAEWGEFLPENVFWRPINTTDGKSLGGLLLSRAEPWQDVEAVLLEQIADVAGHAWNALLKPRRLPTKPTSRVRRFVIGGIVIAIVAAMFLPVHQSVIAPADVIASNPVAVSSPINGVIKEIKVRPNANVRKGDLLFSFEDAELKANYEVALRAVEEAKAELRRASQQAFGDARGRAEVALRRARLALRQEQADYAAYQLRQVNVVASEDGIAVFSDPNKWRGRPVTTGEHVMSLARPGDAELAIYIPVSDAINLRSGAEVRLFLDTDPLHSISAKIELSAYKPSRTPDGILAYRAVATFDDQAALPRIGLKGSAKVLGDRVPLGLFLLRRPLVALRQKIGM